MRSRPTCRARRSNIITTSTTSPTSTTATTCSRAPSGKDKSLEDVVKGSFGKNAGLFNNAGQHYNHIHFWQWMKPNGGGDKIPGNLEKKIVADLGSVAKMKEDFIQAGVTQFGSGWCLARRQGRQDRRHQDRERREPAGARRQADPRLRRVGALLLHRLPQPTAGLSQGLHGSSGELGIRREDVRRGDEVVARPRFADGAGAPVPRSGAGRLQHDSSVGALRGGSALPPAGR